MEFGYSCHICNIDGHTVVDEKTLDTILTSRPENSGDLGKILDVKEQTVMFCGLGMKHPCDCPEVVLYVGMPGFPEIHMEHYQQVKCSPFQGEPGDAAKGVARTLRIMQRRIRSVFHNTVEGKKNITHHRVYGMSGDFGDLCWVTLGFLLARITQGHREHGTVPCKILVKCGQEKRQAIVANCNMQRRKLEKILRDLA